MLTSPELSKRWSVTRELTNTSYEEIATMMGSICLDMEANGLKVEYLTVYVDLQSEPYTRIKILVRLDQYVTNRTMFYWLAHDRADVMPLSYHAFKRVKHLMRKARKTCLVKWGVERQETTLTPANSEEDW